jgi:FkbM family methyltransferase
MIPLAGTRLSAFKLFLSIRLWRNDIHLTNFAGRRVYFRTPDVQALQEVLADHEYEFLASHFANGNAPLVLDVGAHIGTFSIWLLSVSPNANILSVEADPETFKTLSLNVAAAGADANWTAVHGAAGSSQGEIVYLSKSRFSMGHRIDAKGSVPVPTVTLPFLIERLAGDAGDIDLLKIDIEGSEEGFLCTNPEALKRVKAIVVELHPELCNTDRVEALLRNTFDDIQRIGGRITDKPLLYCTRSKNQSPG